MIGPDELNRPIVGVDFDGTIFDAGNTFYPRPEGRLFAGVRRAFIMLKSNGFDLVIYTARDDKLAVWTWLQDHDLAHYVKSVTNKKPKAHVVLFDNAGWRVPSIPNGLLQSVEAWLKEQYADKFTGGDIGPLPTHSNPSGAVQ